MLSFGRNCQAVFESSWTTLHSHQPQTINPLVPHSCQHLEFSVFWMLAILIGMHWCLTVFICVSLMIYNTKHLFVCLFATVFLLWWGVCSGNCPLFKHFYWNMADLQCCVSFCHMTKWINHTCTYTHSVSDPSLCSSLQSTEHSSPCYPVGPQ